jgi:hypothetical protein
VVVLRGPPDENAESIVVRDVHTSDCSSHNVSHQGELVRELLLGAGKLTDPLVWINLGPSTIVVRCFLSFSAVMTAGHPVFEPSY